MTHTKGPWRWVAIGLDDDDGYRLYGPGPLDAAQCIIETTHDVVADEPDAQLIAAAPDLADALENFVANARARIARGQPGFAGLVDDAEAALRAAGRLPAQAVPEKDGGR